MIEGIRTLLRMSSLRQALQLTLIFLVIVLGGGIASIFLVRQEITSQIDSELSDRASLLEKSIQANGAEPVIFSASEERFSAFDQGGALASQLILAEPGFSILELDLQLADFEIEGRWRLLTRLVAGKKLVVGTNLDERDEYIETLVNVFAVSGLVAVLSMLSVGGYFGWRAQRRAASIFSVLDKVAAGDLTAKIGARDGGDDFDHLARSIDQTTERLNVLMRQTRNLSANIAHDLKTPLTRLRGQLEVIEGSVDDPILVSSATVQVDEIIELFESFLRIAELEAGEHRRRFEKLKLAKIVQEVADIYEAVVVDSGREFLVSISGDTQIDGDRRLIIQALANLIENSIKHTPQGSQISLRIHGSDVVVADTGPGIAEEYRNQVFEPMFRLERSRTTPGSGLGLSMVLTIAKLHKAHVHLSDNTTSQSSQPGLSVLMSFPSP